MHFHLPKPLHGWRAFVGEVGIIVIGVLIALAAEQVMESFHDRELAAETRSNIKAEIDSNLGAIKFRMDVEPCVQRRLKQLHTIVDEWSRSGSFQTPKFIGGAPHAAMDFARFDAAQSAGRVALLSNDEQYQVGSIVESLKNVNEVQVDEGLPWGRLKILLSGPASLSPTDRTLVRDALQNADYLDGRFRINVPQLLRRASANGFKPDMGEVRQAIRYYSKTGRYTPSICLSLDASPADVARVTGQSS